MEEPLPPSWLYSILPPGFFREIDVLAFSYQSSAFSFESCSLVYIDPLGVSVLWKSAMDLIS